MDRWYGTIRVSEVEADGDDAVLGMMVQGRAEDRLNVQVILEKQRMFFFWNLCAVLAGAHLVLQRKGRKEARKDWYTFQTPR